MLTFAIRLTCHLATNNTLLFSLEKSHKCQAQGPDVPRDATHLASKSHLRLHKPRVEGCQSVCRAGHLDLDGGPYTSNASPKAGLSPLTAALWRPDETGVSSQL